MLPVQCPWLLAQAHHTVAMTLTDMMVLIACPSQLVQAEAESYSNYALLQQMLPPRIIDTLKSGASLIAEQHPEVCGGPHYKHATASLLLVHFTGPMTRTCTAI